jgi:hypothetical protein
MVDDLLIASNFHKLETPQRNNDGETMKDAAMMLQRLEQQLAALRQTGWQPIETAPEGVRILVSYLFHGERRPSQVDIKELCRGKIIWPSNFYDATHWQPLPAPPHEAVPADESEAM